jgi:Uma2 family endonuclease
MKFAELDLNKVYTYADYFKWKFEERVELIKGKIFRMSPAPSTIHQKLCGEISGQLWSYLRDKKCQVFSAPFDVRLPRKSSDDKEIYTVLQPDVCVICDPAKLDKRGCLGAPDIVVEVLSPGNNAKELKNKYEVYEEAGVKEYWIVQPQYCSFVQYKLENGKYHPSRQLTTGDVVTTDILEGFSLDLTALFAEIDEEEID